jgi:hypothetical protein
MIVFDSKQESPKEPDLVIERIKAKANLWNFLQEIAPELSPENLERDAVINEISKASVRILFPHFSFLELQAELINILDALVVPYSSVEAQKFLPEIVNILKQRMEESRGQK